MFDLKINDLKSRFFDRPRVHKAMDKAARAALSKFGSFVRTRAKSSIRRRKRISAAGQPPSSHTGLLKDFIFFAYEPDAKTVVIGPARLNRTTGAPRLLEEGGTASIFEKGR